MSISASVLQNEFCLIQIDFMAHAERIDHGDRRPQLDAICLDGHRSDQFSLWPVRGV